MSKYVFLSSVFIVTLALLISVRAQAEDFASYTYPTYPFTIKYPMDWSIQDTKNATGVLFKSPDEFGNVLVTIKKTTIPLGKMFDKLVLMESHGFKLLEFNNNTYYLSDHPAIRIVGIQSYVGEGESPLVPDVPLHDAKIMSLSIELGGKLRSITSRLLKNFLTTCPQSNK
ncbi:MAG TPA: hypothetical protein VH500_02800 [Nitrososphaeraceae archaeon]|jgi:hypothetical protein